MIVISKIEEKEWMKFAENSEYSTFFHTPLWYDIFYQTEKEFKIATLKFSFENGAQAIFPLLKKIVSKKFLNDYFFLSGPAGVYGGWISDKKLEESQAREIIDWMGKNIDNFICRLNPFDKEQEYFSHPYLKFKRDFTQFLDLSIGFEKIFDNFSKGHKYNIKKANGNKLEIRIANSQNDYKEYYKVYQDSILRWGSNATNKYSEDLFEKIRLIDDKYKKLWLAVKGEDIISGALVFYFNKHAVWWHGATLKEYFKFYPNDLLQFRIIKDACSKNYKIYDFNPSGSHKGVIDFKSGFGAIKKNSNVIVRNNYKYNIYNGLKKIYIYVKK